MDSPAKSLHPAKQPSLFGQFTSVSTGVTIGRRRLFPVS
jgi:hypothetical protein